MTSTFPTQPPKLDNPLPHTPSGEWAHATTTAIDKSPDASPFVSDGAYAVDPRPPGAFPRGADLSAPPTLDDTRAAADTLAQTVKQYLPTQDGVQRLVQNTGATVKQYLPEAVAGYLPAGGNVSMPSSETHGSQGVSSDGVGALPGSISETSVAKLPDERAPQPAPIAPQEQGTGAPGATVVQRLGDVARQYLPDPVGSYLPTSPTATLPSQEVHGSQGISSDGAGALPGSRSEAGVAKLPDERAQEKTPATSLPSKEAYGSQGVTSGGAGALPGSISETNVAQLPEERVQDTIAATSLPSKEVHGSQGLSSGGAGALPGSVTEKSVAKLPGESAKAIAPMSLPSAEESGAQGGFSSGVGALPGSVSETSVAKLPAEHDHEKTPPAGAETSTHIPVVLTTTNTLPPAPLPPLPAASTPSPLTAERVAQLPSDEHLATSHTAAEPPAPPKRDESASQLSTVAQHGSDAGSLTAKSTPATTAAPSSTGASNGVKPAATNGSNHSADGSSEGKHPHHKATLKDKVRGEAKVISGKLKGDEEKVEEGRRIMREGRD